MIDIYLAVIIILILLVLYLSKDTWMGVENLNPDISVDKVGMKPLSNETLYEMKKRAIKDDTSRDNINFAESREFFSANPDENCSSEFNDSGLAFSDFIKSSAIDGEMVENHHKFVTEIADRGLFTGRTISYDSHDSYDPIPWVGLRRPQNVPVGNPDQLPDIDRSVYDNTQVLKW